MNEREDIVNDDIKEAIRQRENMTRRERIRMHVHMFFWNMNRTWRHRQYHIANKRLDISIWWTKRKIERIINKYDKENK
jgi:hypothetical protein